MKGSSLIFIFSSSSCHTCEDQTQMGERLRFAGLPLSLSLSGGDSRMQMPYFYSADDELH